MYLTIPDPLEGYVAPSPWPACKPSCTCESDTSPLCDVCEAEWAAMLSDADVHPEDDTTDDDPWTREQRDPEVDDVWGWHERLEACGDNL